MQDEEQMVKLIDKIIEFSKKKIGYSSAAAINYEPIDAAKLFDILHERELIEIYKDSNGYKKAYDLVVQAASYVSKINSPDLKNAIVDLAKLDDLINVETSGDTFVLCKQWLLSVQALYHYRCRDWDTAYENTLKCISLIDYLVLSGFQTLIVRNIEQNLNLGKILLKSGRIEESLVFFSGVYDYLFVGKTNKLIGGTFHAKNRYDFQTELREASEPQMFCGLVEVFLKCVYLHGRSSDKVFKQIFRNTRFSIINYDRILIANWFQIKKLYLKKDFMPFLNQASVFFDQVADPFFDILKFAIYLDVIELLKSCRVEIHTVLLEMKINIGEKLVLNEFCKKLLDSI